MGGSPGPCRRVRPTIAHDGTSWSQHSRTLASLRTTVQGARTEAAGHFLDGVALHLRHGHLPQLLGVQQAEKAVVLLVHLGGEFRSRLGADHLGEAASSSRAGGRQVRLGDHPAAAAFLPLFVLAQVQRLAGGQHQQELPQVVAVVQAGEAALFGRPAEAVEGAQGHVLLVGRLPRRCRELGAGQADEAGEVALPQRLGRCRVARLEQVQPVGNRPKRRHCRFQASKGKTARSCWSLRVLRAGFFILPVQECPVKGLSTTAGSPQSRASSRPGRKDV